MRVDRQISEFESLKPAERERHLHEATIDIVARMSEGTRASVEAALVASPATLDFWRKLVRQGSERRPAETPGAADAARNPPPAAAGGSTRR